MPIGKITKPADGKTSHSEGAACHMGRAAQYPKSATTQEIRTELCRRIYSN